VHAAAVRQTRRSDFHYSRLYRGKQEKPYIPGSFRRGNRPWESVLSFRILKNKLCKAADVFWHNIDPTTQTGSFATSGINIDGNLHHNEKQKTAEESNRHLKIKPSKAIVTEITPATQFYRRKSITRNIIKTRSVKFQRYNCGGPKTEGTLGSTAGH
jgi:hypothetical protein